MDLPKVQRWDLKPDNHPDRSKMDVIEALLGINREQMTPFQMACRAVVIFFISLVMVRIAGLRTLGKQSSFDIVTSLILGAILGRAVVTDQSFIGSILAALVLALLHRFFAWLGYKNKIAGAIIKGRNIILIKDGVRLYENMSKVHVTENDILEAMRRDGNINDPDQIQEAHLERSGEISIIKKEQ
jgi:uncharacterized membrane protein YcaP (DUF421 family)